MIGKPPLVIALTVALAALLLPPRRLAADPTAGGASSLRVTGPPNGPSIYVDFHVGGADVHTEVDANGNLTGRYTGRITGDKLSVSGTAHFGMGAGKTYLSLSVTISAGDQHAEHHWPPEGGRRTISAGEEGFTIDESFALEVTVPKIAPTAAIGFHWTHCGDWVCGGLEAGVSLSGPKALCPEAATLFHLVKGGGSNLQFDLGDLIADLQRAMAAHPGGVTISDSHVTPIYTAYKWLMPNGFQEDEQAIRRWSFTDFRNVDVSGVTNHQADLYSGAYTPPAGAGEARLAQATAMAAQERGHPITPGELLGLALRQTGGDARRAAMLSHNMLKALGRGGGSRVTGLNTDHDFFRKFLAPLRDDRTGSADNANRSVGEWYHLFGTMAFRLETIQGLNGFSDRVLRTGSTVGTYLAALAAALSLKVTAPVLASGVLVSNAGPRSRRIREFLTNLVRQGFTPGQLGYSEWANWAEQVFREQIDPHPKPPDPEKYCINVWGVELANAIYRHVYTDSIPREFFDSIHVNPWSNIAGDSFGLNGPPVEFDPTQPLPRIDLGSNPGSPEPPLRILGVHSPVDTVLEVDGRAMVLAQSVGMLVGDVGVPVYAAPEPDGTYMFAAVTRVDRPVKLSLFGVAEGTAHIAHLDTATGRFTTWSEPVRSDTVLTLNLDSATAKVGTALQRADGTTVAPIQTVLGPTPAGSRAAWTLALLGGAGLVLLALALLRRRLRRNMA